MKKPASGKRDRFLSAPLLLMLSRLLGKGLGLVFSSFIILSWQSKIIIGPETKWELRKKPKRDNKRKKDCRKRIEEIVLYE